MDVTSSEAEGGWDDEGSELGGCVGVEGALWGCDSVGESS